MAQDNDADYNEDDAKKKWAQLVAQTWTDDSLKQRLIAHPESVLKEHGIELPPGVEVRVVENTDKVNYLMLPSRPAGGVTELTSNELESVAGGLFCCWYPSCVSYCPYKSGSAGACTKGCYSFCA